MEDNQLMPYQEESKVDKKELFKTNVSEEYVKKVKKAFDLDWTNPPTVEDLDADYNMSKNAFAADMGRISHWVEVLEAPRGTNKNRSNVSPKLVRKLAEWKYAPLAAPFTKTKRLFDVGGVSGEEEITSLIVEQILNFQFEYQINKVRFFDDLVSNLVDHGTAIIKYGWDYQEVVETFEVEYAELDKDGDPTGRTLVEDKEEAIPIRNQPHIELCDYDTFFPDPSCEGNLSKALYVVHRYSTNYLALKDNPSYKNLEVVLRSVSDALSGETADEQERLQYDVADLARRRFFVNEYWGYWDINGDGNAVPIVATYAGGTLIRLEESPFPGGELPFVTIQYMSKPKEIFGEADAALIEDNQEISKNLTRGVLDLFSRSANAQQGVMKGFLNPVNLKKFNEGKTYEFNPTGRTPNEAIFLHKYPEIPQSVMGFLNLQTSEAEALTGKMSFSSGITGNAYGRTAAGANNTQAATTEREMAFVDRISEGIKTLGRRMAKMNAYFLDDEDIQRMSACTEEEFELYTPDIILNDKLLFSLTVSTSEGKQRKLSGLEFVLQTTGGRLPEHVLQKIYAEMLRLQGHEEMAEEIRLYQPEPDPMEEQKKVIELEILMAQKEFLLAKAERERAQAQIVPYKADVESAKARKTNSEADLKDRQYIDETTGESFNRELQKQEHATQQRLEERTGAGIADTVLRNLDAGLTRATNPSPRFGE